MSNTDTEIIKLNQKEAKWFFDLIDNAQEPTCKLKEAFARYNSKKITNEGASSTFKID